MKGQNYGQKRTSLHEELKTRRAKNPDKSMGLKGPSVDSGAKRSGTAKTPATLGPRKTGM